MTFRSHLKKFCDDCFAELSADREFPRPPFTSPGIADDSGYYSYKLSQLPSYINLREYMNSSGISDLLRGVGHQWFWHTEVFAWLFLERVFSESRGNGIDPAGFDTVFKRANAELKRPSFRLRHIAAIEGIPQVQKPVSLGPGLSIRPINFSSHHYELSDLLGWRYQDKHRPIDVWLNPGTCLLIQDQLITKDGDGGQIHTYFESWRRQHESIILALKLVSDWYIYPKATFTAHLSAFPLVPLSRENNLDFDIVSLSEQKPMTAKFLRGIRSNFKFLNSLEQGSEPDYIVTALNKFADSYRIRHEEQSVVDLVIILEAMLGVRQEELRRRLALNAAVLIGKNESESNDVFNKIQAAYRMRNAIVHGGRRQTEELARALRVFDPDLDIQTADDLARGVAKTVLEIRGIVRQILVSYIHMRTQKTRDGWPTAEQIEAVQFNSVERHALQRQLGIVRS